MKKTTLAQSCLFTLIMIFSSLPVFAQSAEGYYNSGSEKFQMKDLPGAITDFTKAISKNPNYEMAYMKRALCRMGQGNWSLAIPDCNMAIKINPNQAVAFFVRGCAKANTQQDGCIDLKKSLNLGYSQAQKALNKYCN